MQTKEFRTLHLNNLTIDNLFSLSKSTIEYANPVKESIGNLPKVILARLETDNNAMGVQMNKALKSALTAQVTALFNQLDELRKTYARLIHKKDGEEERSPVVAE